MKRRNKPTDVLVSPSARIGEVPVGSAPAQVTAPVSAEARQQLGQLLHSQHGVSSEQISDALNMQTESGRKLGSILVDQGWLDARELTEALANQLGLPTVDLRREMPAPDALALVPEETARQLGIMPLRLIDGVLDVAVIDGADDEVLATLRRLPVDVVNVFLAPAPDIESSLTAHYRLISHDDDQVRWIWAQATPEEDVQRSDLDDAPIIQLVNNIIRQAKRDRVSDIHIEPTDGRIRIRFRVDGALREVLSLPGSAGPELVSRIKIMAEMDIVERRRPQDGQFQMTLDGSGIDVRVATGATIFGEGAVLRLLDKSRSIMKLNDLGMPHETHDRFAAIVHKPYGMIICSGPTGSGKTTTLYATLSDVSRSELNVMTIEDPVEYVFPAINQMQINLQADVTFASGLKLILRQDPDVILVGEIRDTETASIAVQAALTGHLVMTSLHATDASAALFRLIDMGVEPFLVASSLVGVVGQRLVRKICPSCAAPYKPSAADLNWYEYLGGQPKSEFIRGTGCTYCSHTGFRERVGVYEVLEVTDEIGQLLVQRATPNELRDLAKQQGMRTMGDEAARLIADDITTIDEVIRNVFVS